MSAETYYSRNRERVLARNKAWNAANKDKMRIVFRRHDLKRKERVALAKKMDRINHPEKYRAIDKAAYARARERVLKRQRDFNRTPQGKLTTLLRNTCRRIAKLGKIASPNKKDILGAPIEMVRLHIESLFKQGMSWENHGKHGWHIDHIRPLASFDLTDPEQIKRAGHYTNLAPIWAYENLSKGAKVA